MKTLDVATDFTGIGAFEQALKLLNIKHNVVFACDKDKYARQTYAANHLTEFDLAMEKIGTLGTLTQGDWACNFYFPHDVYKRKIPTQPLDIYVTTPPCQAFSLAGKRNGENDKRGILFYNSHEFISINKPRFFIFENVKGLLSDDAGRTFAKWLDLLGGKTVNGNPVIFPHQDSVPYHIYYKVLNAKHYGIPQNRERVFIIGIRDDADNTFTWPKPIPLTTTLKNVLETKVDKKYYLSDKMLEKITYTGKKTGIVADVNKCGQKGSVFSENSKTISSLTATDYKQPKQIQVEAKIKKEGYVNQDTQASEIISENGLSKTISAGTHGYAQGYIKISSKNQDQDHYNQELEINQNGTSNTISTVEKDNLVVKFERTENAKQERKKNKQHTNKDTGKFADRKMVLKKQDYSDTILANPNPVKDNLISEPVILDHRGHKNKAAKKITNGVVPTLRAESHGHQPKVETNYQIRRLTPRECLRLMGFPDSFKIVCSDTQTYKQAGNSVVVNVYMHILQKLLTTT